MPHRVSVSWELAVMSGEDNSRVTCENVPFDAVFVHLCCRPSLSLLPRIGEFRHYVNQTRARGDCWDTEKMRRGGFGEF